MQRHYQVIYESILSVFIVVDIAIMSLMIIGFSVGIMYSTINTVDRFI